MSSERRVVRPYIGVDRFQTVLDTWTLRIGPELVEAGEQCTISSSSYLVDPPIIAVAPDDDALDSVHKELAAATEAMGFEPADVELVVIAATPYLRLADVLHRRSLEEADAVPREIVVTSATPTPRAMQTPSGGCDFDVYFTLARQRPPQPLQPSRQGTWLGHIRFSLRTEFGEVGFTPRPLTAEVRGQLLSFPLRPCAMCTCSTPRLSSRTMWPRRSSSTLDETILAVLNQSPHTPAARFFQRQLYLDVMVAVVNEVRSSEDLRTAELAELDGTVLGRIVVAAAGRGRQGETAAQLEIRQETALRWLRDKPQQFLALVESTCAPGDDLRRSTRGVDE